MPSTKNLIWLASYPKSGNTWVRVLLSNYLNDNIEGVDINKIDSSIISSSRSIFDSYTPFLSSDLNNDEIDILRPNVYKSLSDENEEFVCIKTHDAFTKNKKNKNIFPLSATKGIIHIVRNPLDVAVSFAHHSNITIEKSIKFLNNRKALSTNPKQLNPQLRQQLLSWSQHYLSWSSTPAPYLQVTYEKLIEDTEKEFRKIILFIYNEVDVKKLKKAVKQSAFKELRKQEQTGNFKERAIQSKSFFRKGKSGSWKNEMSEEQIKEIIKKNSTVMEELGYL